MNIKYLFLSVCLLFPLFGFGQNPKESAYTYEVLQPDHNKKPKVTGWATTRSEEKLNRGFEAYKTDQGVYFSWRLLKSDGPETTFNIFAIDNSGKPSKKLNGKPIQSTTDFSSAIKPSENSQFLISVLVKGKEMETQKVKIQSKTYKSIPLQGDYAAYRMASADLNGDGTFDFVILQPYKSNDPAFAADTTGLTYKLEAYLADGTFLWRIDLGLGIEPGTWYSPFVVFDFNGDGKAEVAAKTGPNQRNKNGRVTEGPEWFTVFNGMTGQEIAKADWPDRNPGFGDYNRINRNQLGVAYLDGKTPSLITARGTYRKMVVDAWQLEGNKLTKQWRWDGDEENPVIRAQGAHSMISADLDEDGRDEILVGSAAIDDNGTLLWSTGMGHPDKIYVTDIDPAHPGMEVFYAIEPGHQDGKGVAMVDAKTGNLIWSIGKPTMHVGDGMVADIDPSKPGLECFALEDPKGGSNDKYLFSAQGVKFGEREDVPGCRNWVFWDADKLRETFLGDGYGSVKNTKTDKGTGYGTAKKDKVSIAKYSGEIEQNDLDGKVLLTADLTGDWREEVVTSLPGELRIYATNIPATDKRITLMQDPVYRLMIAHRSMGYMQSPVTGYYLGE